MIEAPRSVLLEVFPGTRVLPAPPLSAPVGRRWFSQHGVLDQEISSAHALFRENAHALTIEDASSRNGTWVDGRRLAEGERRELEDGAVVRIGRTLFVFRAAFEGAAEPLAPVGRLVAPFGLRALRREIEELAATRPDAVLVEGETGTGKELLARHVAAVVQRGQPFTKVSAAGGVNGSMEARLFGERGEDVPGSRRGILHTQEGGTVFVDEIAEMGLELQSKLFGVIERRALPPEDDEPPHAVDALFILATNRNLDRQTELGGFRRELLERVSAARLHVPPLRERREDIYAIVLHLARQVALELPAEQVEVEAVERLLLAPWPTNVRGLVDVLRRAASLDADPGLRLWAVARALQTEEPPPPVPPAAVSTSSPAQGAASASDPAPKATSAPEANAHEPESIDAETPSSEPPSKEPDAAATAGPPKLTRERVERALAEASGNVTEAARRLGVSRSRLRRFRKKR